MRMRAGHRKSLLFSIAAAGAAWLCLLSGCAPVPQRDRGVLADPVMQRVPDPLGSDLETHNLPRREGSAGAGSGSGGGCGC
jgi:hypothetical protein